MLLHIDNKNGNKLKMVISSCRLGMKIMALNERHIISMFRSFATSVGGGIFRKM